MNSTTSLSFKPIFQGQVQCLSFGHVLCHSALTRAIKGKMKDIPNPSVSLIMEGPKANLKTLLSLVKQGDYKIITDFKSAEICSPHHRDFTIEY